MRRRLALFFGSLVVLLAGCGLYWLIAGTDREIDSPAERIVAVFAEETAAPAATTRASDEVLIMARDERGRLEAIYRADSWDKQDDGSYRLTNPNVQLFQRDGQALIIRADEGSIYAEEQAGGVNPRRGWLSGNVEILYDRAVNPATPIEQREADLIRAYVDDVHFDNDLLQVSTESHVTVFSPEADILGRGLVIRWNEDPQELRRLEILEGQYMALKQTLEALELTPTVENLGGGGEGSAIEPAPLALEQGDALANLDQLGGAGRPVEPTTQPDSQPVVAATLPADEPTTAPAGERRNVYRATFYERVNVDSGERSLRDAETLSLVFEWDSRDEAGPLAPRAATQPTEPTTQPIAPPVTQPADLAAETQPATEAAAMTVVTWTGPLVIEPAGYAETPSRERFRVAARGAEMVLADGRGVSHCTELVFVSPEQVGRLSGGKDRPVRIGGLGDEQQLVCREVRFDRSRRLAWLAGPGYIEASPPANAGDEATGETSVRASGGRIAWQGSVVARLGTTEVPGQGGSAEERLTVTEAIFSDGVRLTSQDGTDDIQCDRLHVWVAEGPLGPYPSRAVAEGNVLARQADGKVTAEKLTVEFVQLAALDDVGEQRAELQPTSMVAEGGPDSLAMLRRGENTISGRKIVFDRTGDWAEVEGSGRLAFVSESDFGGRKLDKPQPVQATWSDGMTFDGATNVAVLTGDVELFTESDSIRCDRMEVTFTEPDGEQTSPAGADPLETEGLGTLRLAMAEAEGHVVIRSSRMDEQGRLTQRLQLTGARLIYDARTGQIDGLGAGTLLAEDYRAPEAQNPNQTVRVQRPWQTAFTWRNYMRLTRADDGSASVLMDGQVTMSHHSGRTVVGTDRLNVPPWPGIEPGRVVTLGCGALSAEFAPNKSQAGETAAAGSSEMDFGSRVGPINRFSATRDVILTDGQYSLKGDSLTYNRQEALAILQGSPVASVSQQDPRRARATSVTSPKIHCYLDETGHIRKVVVPSARGGAFGR